MIYYHLKKKNLRTKIYILCINLTLYNICVVKTTYAATTLTKSLLHIDYRTTIFTVTHGTLSTVIWTSKKLNYSVTKHGITNKFTKLLSS